METLNTDRLFGRVSKKEEKDNSKLFVVINDANYIAYKIELDEKKLRLFKEELVKKYSDYETITRENVRIDGPRGISDHFIHGNIEVIDSVTTNTYSTSFGDGPVCGGPVYADVAADIKRHPAIEKVINQFLFKNDIDLNNIYRYVCNLKNIEANAVSVEGKPGVIKIINMGFSNSIILSNKEKEITEMELKNIFESIFECFTVIDVENKDVVNGQLAITTEITLEELKKLKEDITVAKSNGKIISSEVMINLFGDNCFTKQKKYNNN